MRTLASTPEQSIGTRDVKRAPLLATTHIDGSRKLPSAPERRVRRDGRPGWWSAPRSAVLRCDPKGGGRCSGALFCARQDARDRRFCARPLAKLWWPLTPAIVLLRDGVPRARRDKIRTHGRGSRDGSLTQQNVIPERLLVALRAADAGGRPERRRQFLGERSSKPLNDSGRRA